MEIIIFRFIKKQGDIFLFKHLPSQQLKELCSSLARTYPLLKICLFLVLESIIHVINYSLARFSKSHIHELLIIKLLIFIIIVSICVFDLWS